MRKAKKRTYDRMEQAQEFIDKSHTKKSLGWITNVFSTKPQSTVEDKQRMQDEKIIDFYEESLETLKGQIRNLNVPNFERSYIELIQELNRRKWLTFIF